MELTYSSPMSNRLRATDPTEVADLRQGGVLSLRLLDYQEPPLQIEMAALVAEALITYSNKRQHTKSEQVLSMYALFWWLIIR